MGVESFPWFLVYGPLGSGVSSALKIYKELGYTTFHGVHPASALEFLQTAQSQSAPIALNPEFDPNMDTPEEAKQLLSDIKTAYPQMPFLYLSTTTDVLIQRFAKSEKLHRYDKGGLKETIEKEQAIYTALKPLADYHIDSGTTTVVELAGKIHKVLGLTVKAEPMTINLVSFGFKHGVPTDAEMVFDMRIMPNPFYDEKLRPLTGLDQPVVDYLFAQPETETFLHNWQTMLAHALPMYQVQGKTRVSIAIGCTGGQHRSVAMLMQLANFLKKTFPDYHVNVQHREQHHWPKTPAPMA